MLTAPKDQVTHFEPPPWALAVLNLFGQKEPNQLLRGKQEGEHWGRELSLLLSPARVGAGCPPEDSGDEV